MSRTSTRALAVAGTLAVATALASCTSAAPAPYASPSANPGTDSVITVTDANIDAAVADLPANVAAAMDATGNPGVAVAVVHGDELLYSEGFGVRNLDTGEPVDADTVFRIASVSKSVGATVIARAIDEGLVTWDTPVVDNLPWFALSDPYVTENVTIADMYSHRSGLPLHAGDELEDLGYDRREVLERLRLLPLSPFRTHYAYGNFDITAAAESVSVAAGEDWAELSERLVYGPLGMTSTSSRAVDFDAIGDRAVGHIQIDGEWVVSPVQRQPDAQSPAGGVSSSVTDMAAWMTMLLSDGAIDGAPFTADGEPFVSGDALVPAITPQIVSGPPPAAQNRAGFYGFGFNVSTTAGALVDVNHSGAFALGTGAVVKMLPEADLGIVVLSNGSANGVVEGIAGRFFDIAQFGEQRRDWLDLFVTYFASQAAPFGELAGQEPPADPAPAAPLDEYVGVYANDYFGPATVSIVGDGLELAVGPTGRFALTHWDGHVFVYDILNENAYPGSVSQVTFDGDTMVVEFLDQRGLGTFLR